MNYRRIACFDVYYYKDYARASCIVFERGLFEKIIANYSQRVESVENYISGEFYRRELPCLFEVYSRVKEDIGLIIVVGYVFLKDGKKGLGAYLFERLGGEIPVIGVAKNYFEGCTNYTEVYRGQSSRPLYVSSIGVELREAAKLIKNLGGENRIPNILRKVDQLTRMDKEI